MTEIELAIWRRGYKCCKRIEEEQRHGSFDQIETEDRRVVQGEFEADAPAGKSVNFAASPAKWMRDGITAQRDAVGEGESGNRRAGFVQDLHAQLAIDLRIDGHPRSAERDDGG